MMKMKKILSLIMMAMLLFSGCAKNSNATVFVYASSGMEEKNIMLNGISAQSLLKELQNAGIVEANAEVQDFSKDKELITLDLSEEFDISVYVAESQKIIMQCIANTFLKNYGAESIIITRNNKPIVNGECDFSEELKYISPEEFNAKMNEATPELTPEPTATSAPTADAEIQEKTAEPTKKPTAKPTWAPASVEPRQEGKKYVSITFDDGPHRTYTRKIAEKLKEHNATATFFVVGNRIDDVTTEAMRYAVDCGCEIEIHGYTHEVYYNKCSDETYRQEISKTREAIEKAVNKTPRQMRPIGGAISNERIQSSEYAIITWNIDSEDWKHKKNDQSEIDTIVNNVMSNVKPDGIILMHEIYKNSYEAFCIIIDKLYEQGYEVVSVSRLLGEKMKPGTKYSGG